MVTSLKNIPHNILKQHLSPKSKSKLSQSVKNYRNANLYRSFEKSQLKGSRSIYWGDFGEKTFKFKDHPYIKAQDVVLFSDFDMKKRYRCFGEFSKYIEQHNFRTTGKGKEPKRLVKPFDLYKVERSTPTNSKLKLVKVTDNDNEIFNLLIEDGTAYKSIAKRLVQLSWARIHKENREKAIEKKKTTAAQTIQRTARKMLQRKKNAYMLNQALQNMINQALQNKINKKKTTAAQTIQRTARKMLQRKKMPIR